jgi:hypothetical protein
MSEGIKLCECGCGQPAPVAPKTVRKYGWVKGQPKRFVHGHNGRKVPGLGYSAAHKYLSRHFPKAGVCEKCGTRDKTEHALIHGREHSHDREDYRELCVPCHKWYDNGGERNANARLTEAAVRDIRARCAESRPYGTLTRLAEEYGVTLSVISKAVLGNTWRGVM